MAGVGAGLRHPQETPVPVCAQPLCLCQCRVTTAGATGDSADPPVPLPACPKWGFSKVHPALTLFQQFCCPGNCTLGVSQSERQLECGRKAGFLSLSLSLQAQVPFPSWCHIISAPAAPPGLPLGNSSEKICLGLLPVLISSCTSIFGAIWGL